MLFLVAMSVQPLLAGTYHVLNVPSSIQTGVGGVNNLDQIVGWYDDAKGNSHGFLLSAGKYTTLDFGTGNETEADGISDAGVIVGWYQTAPPFVGPPHGWIYQNGTFTQIDYPGAYGTFPQAVNKDGVVVGYWDDSTQQNFGAFKYVNGTFSAITIPNAISSLAWGINNNGDISGGYSVTLHGGIAGYGFILHTNGQLQTIKAPGNPTDSGLRGINDKLQGVGEYAVPNTAYSSGFIYNNGKFSPINFPNASSTVPADMNNSGIVVGTWYATGSKQDIPQGFYFVP
jgi:probable HAF family extracellular repeat protein